MPRNTPPDGGTPIESSTEKPEDHEPAATAAPVAAPVPESTEPSDGGPVAPRVQAVPGPPSTPHVASAPSIVAMSTGVSESVTSLRAPARRLVDEEPEAGPRFAERAVAVPVTRLSDGRPREETPPQAAGDRPVMQLLTLGLLISMIVLVSAAVGVLVGRWMTQR